MAVVESRHQAVALPAIPPVGVVVTVEVAYPPAATPESTPRPADTLSLAPTPAPAEVASTGCPMTEVCSIAAAASLPLTNVGPTSAPHPGGTGNVRRAAAPHPADRQPPRTPVGHG
jgi:hypothetical protein